MLLVVLLGPLLLIRIHVAAGPLKTYACACIKMKGKCYAAGFWGMCVFVCMRITFMWRKCKIAYEMWRRKKVSLLYMYDMYM